MKSKSTEELFRNYNLANGIVFIQLCLPAPKPNRFNDRYGYGSFGNMTRHRNVKGRRGRAFNPFVEPSVYEMTEALTFINYKFIAQREEELKAERKAKRIAAEARKIERDNLAAAQAAGFKTYKLFQINLRKKAKIQAKIDAKNSRIEHRELLKRIGVNDSRLDEIKAFRLDRLFSSSHKMGCKVEIKIESNPIQRWDDRQEYKGGKYSATHGDVVVNLTKKEARKLQMIGGVPTIIGRQVANKIFKCEILKNDGTQFAVHVARVPMYITHGHHADSISECLTWRKMEVLRICSQKLKTKDYQAFLAKAKRRFIGLKHSISVGNCEIGTKNFAKQFNLNPDMGYRVDYLIEIAPENPYLVKIINSL